MPKCSLTWHKSKANRIMRDIKSLKQQDIADEIGESQQTVSYRIRKQYPNIMPDLIKVLNLAGYEIVQKGE